MERGQNSVQTLRYGPIHRDDLIPRAHSRPLYPLSSSQTSSGFSSVDYLLTDARTNMGDNVAKAEEYKKQAEKKVRTQSERLLNRIYILGFLLSCVIAVERLWFLREQARGSRRFVREGKLTWRVNSAFMFEKRRDVCASCDGHFVVTQNSSMLSMSIISLPCYHQYRCLHLVTGAACPMQRHVSALVHHFFIGCEQFQVGEMLG